MKELHFFRMHVKGNKEGKFSLIQYVQCSQPLDIMDIELQCIVLQRSTDHNIDHTSIFGEQSLRAEKWFENAPIFPIKAMPRMMKKTLQNTDPNESRAWPLRRFYINVLIEYNYRIQRYK